MGKLTNNTRGDIGLASRRIVPAGESIEITDADVTAPDTWRNITGYFSTGDMEWEPDDVESLLEAIPERRVGVEPSTPVKVKLAKPAPAAKPEPDQEFLDLAGQPATAPNSETKAADGPEKKVT